MFLQGYCRCGNVFVSYIDDAPDLTNDEDVILQMITGDTGNIPHGPKRQLAGEFRKDYGKELVHEPVKKFKDKLAGKILSESGTQQHKILHDSYIYQTCRQEERDEKLNLDKSLGIPFNLL